MNKQKIQPFQIVDETKSSILVKTNKDLEGDRTVVLPLETIFDTQGNHRWEDVPVRFLWT